ncbi:MAG: hypothetical protein K2Y22_13110 [Candidatus Obscuribacterales bacterium]|nr:hypothetical protein [Candidatus Obscuribacterales bacterium]
MEQKQLNRTPAHFRFRLHGKRHLQTRVSLETEEATLHILFDQGTPVPLRTRLLSHKVSTAFELGWSELKNSELLQAAEQQFDVLVTADKHLQCQQNFTDRKIAILVLPFECCSKLQQYLPIIVSTIDQLKLGDYVEIEL